MISSLIILFFCRRLFAFPNGYRVDYLSLYLEVADSQSLPSGWRRYVKFSISIVNQLSQELSVQQGDSYFTVTQSYRYSNFFISLLNMLQFMFRLEFYVFVWMSCLDILL